MVTGCVVLALSRRSVFRDVFQTGAVCLQFSSPGPMAGINQGWYLFCSGLSGRVRVTVCFDIRRLHYFATNRLNSLIRDLHMTSRGLLLPWHMPQPVAPQTIGNFITFIEATIIDDPTVPFGRLRESAVIINAKPYPLANLFFKIDFIYRKLIPII